MAKLSMGRIRPPKGRRQSHRVLVAKVLLPLSLGSGVAMQGACLPQCPIGKEAKSAGSRARKDTGGSCSGSPKWAWQLGCHSPGSTPRCGGVEGPPARVRVVAWMARLTMQWRGVKLSKSSTKERSEALSPQEAKWS